VEEGAATLEVASYNVHGCVGVDRRRDPERVGSVIRELDADVVSLQEVLTGGSPGGGSAQLAALARATELESVAGPTFATGRHGFGNAVLSRHPIMACRRLDLSVPFREPRGALEVDLAINDSIVRVVGTHLGLRTAERRIQIMRLLEMLRRESEQGLLIVLGDFNEWMPSAWNLRCLRDRFGVTAAPPTFPSWRPLLALDRIWVRPGHALHAVRVHASRLARRASDHLPILGTVQLAPGA
jgi:endonuclease/exonuclease/phosphatase family metal-dependent hydrolase